MATYTTAHQTGFTYAFDTDDWNNVAVGYVNSNRSDQSGLLEEIITRKLTELSALDGVARIIKNEVILELQKVQDELNARK